MISFLKYFLIYFKAHTPFWIFMYAWRTRECKKMYGDDEKIYKDDRVVLYSPGFVHNCVWHFKLKLLTSGNCHKVHRVGNINLSFSSSKNMVKFLPLWYKSTESPAKVSIFVTIISSLLGTKSLRASWSTFSWEKYWNFFLISARNFFLSEPFIVRL